jgi:hypothetical protein
LILSPELINHLRQLKESVRVADLLNEQCLDTCKKTYYAIKALKAEHVFSQQQREELKKKQFLMFEKGRVDEDLYEKADSLFGTDLSKYDGLVRKAYADYVSAAILAAKYAISENKFEEFISDPEYRVKITKIKRSSLPKFQSIEGFDVNIAASIGDKVIQFIINNPDKVRDKISEIRSNSYFPCSGLSSFFDEE